jgi:outer membrane protein assembly factor BamB
MRRATGLTLLIFILAGAAIALNAGAQSAAPAAGGHWPQWRGPNRDGISTEKNLLQSWPAGGPRKILTATGMGAGFSSVAVTGGRIYTMGDRRDGQYALAFNEADGAPLWSARVGEVHQDEYGGPRATPTVDGHSVYVLSSDGTIVALDAATGRNIWSKSLTRDYRAPTPGWLFAESPLVDGPNVIVSPGSSTAAVVALEKTTGKEIWRSQASGGSGAEYSSIVISHGGGVKQYVRLSKSGVIGVRATDGQFLWSYGRVANGVANIPTPLIKGDLVFASSGYQTGAALLQLTEEPQGRVRATEKYFLEGRTFQNHHGGMILIGDHVYAGHGHNAGFPMCLELTTGKVLWGGNFRNDGSGSAAVTAADGHLYFRYQNGVMMLIEATPTAYREKGKFEIPGVRNPSWSHPVVAGGRLYLREQDALHVYDVKR